MLSSQAFYRFLSQSQYCRFIKLGIHQILEPFCSGVHDIFQPCRRCQAQIVGTCYTVRSYDFLSSSFPSVSLLSSIRSMIPNSSASFAPMK